MATEIMHGDKLVDFLWFASIHPEFADYLFQHGIKKRPKCDEGDERLKAYDKTVSLTFSGRDSYADCAIFPAKSEGWCIFVSIEIKKDSVVQLPFNLSFDMNKANLSSILGNPIGEEEDYWVFFYKNLIVISFLKENTHDVDIFKFQLLDAYDVNNYNLPIQMRF
ncbi:hypothetical protein [Serratia microhaemolytica]|uniref:hypothetical protein n=1 Tax=Serratia microhaemolytica TaxID=2675110 RepID=UPI000FDD6915|nr:hypothetical protein [Serratia microhaemolytica]